MAGVSLKTFIAALQAEGIIDAFGPYLKGKPLYRYPVLSKAQTYGRSGFPLCDELGIPRADYTSLNLPNIERLLPGLGFFHMRNIFVEDEAADIARAVRKVAHYYARHPGPSATVKPPAPPRISPVPPPTIEPRPVWARLLHLLRGGHRNRQA